jgi:hypothetical protein
MKALTLAPVLALAAFALLAPPLAEARDSHGRSDRSWKRHEEKRDRYESRSRAKDYNNYRQPRYRSHYRSYGLVPRYRGNYYRGYDNGYYDNGYYDEGYYAERYPVYPPPTYCPPRVRVYRHRRPHLGVFLGF